jgi:MtN3 and saliva related transmembrane protein
MILAIVGFIGFFTSTVSMLPQLYQTFKTKSAKDLSTLMLINIIVCSLSWIAYGVLTNALAIWITNVFMTIVTIVILILKFKYSSKL